MPNPLNQQKLVNNSFISTIIVDLEPPVNTERSVCNLSKPVCTNKHPYGWIISQTIIKPIHTPHKLM